MEKDNAIEVRGLYKDFKLAYDKPSTLKERLVFWDRSKNETRTVLRDISLDIKMGDTVALIGINGSGKSTLLKLMTKILYPNKGMLETKGKLTSLLELGAGFHPDFSGRENIYFNASIFGLTRQQIDNRIDEIIAFSELGNFIDSPVRTYSSGMYMRLAFSVAINVDADILLIDEILAVGDQHFQDKCFRKLEELKNSEKTIVIVTHSLDVVKKLCDRAIWIYKGEFRLDGDPIYVINEYLKQVALDHQEEKKKAVESGVDKYHGTVYIDSPKDFIHVDKNEILEIVGWEISDCANSKLRIIINGDEIGAIDRIPRPDVMEVYAEQYGGLAKAETLGWKVVYDPRIVEKSTLIIKVIVSDNTGKEISNKELSLYLDDFKGEV